MFRLFRYASNYKKEVILGPIFKFLEAVFELFTSFIYGQTS